jgi:DNA primase
VVNEDPERWAKLIAAARPIVEHVMDTLAADRDLDNPKEKSDIAKQVLPLIRDLPEAIERDHYLQRLARVLKVDERALLDAPRPVARGRRPRTQAPRRPAVPVPLQTESAPTALLTGANTHVLEAYCLGIIMRHPELLYQVDRALGEAGLERLSSNDFQHTDHQVMYRVSMEALEQEHSEPISYALNNLPQPLIDLADDILSKTNELDPNEERVLEDLLRAVLRIREERLNQMNDQLRQLMQEAQDDGTLIPIQYAQTRARNAHVELHLDKAIARYSDRSISTAK